VENGARRGCDQPPLLQLDVMICIVVRSLDVFVMYTVRPSGVNDDANTSPVLITPGANKAAVSLRVYTGGGSTGSAVRDRAQASAALHTSATATRRAKRGGGRKSCTRRNLSMAVTRNSPLVSDISCRPRHVWHAFGNGAC